MSQPEPPQRNVNEIPRSENPRRVRHGIKLRHRDAPKAVGFLAQRWLTLIEDVFPAHIKAEAFEYAKAGQTASLDVQPGVINARVQGRAFRAYHVQLRVQPCSSQEWAAVINEMAGSAIFVASMLAGEVPSSVDEVFSTLNIELIPREPEQLVTTCTCAEPTRCKHAAAAAYVMVERLSEDPLQVFLLYGMPASDVLDQLRHARAIHTHGVASAHADPMIPESQAEPEPLEAHLDTFWRCGHQLDELQQAPPPQHLAHALLRRLGPSPMQGRFPLVGLLASIYDTVAQDAIRIRDRAEHIDPQNPSE
jgi:uncharacterized Zn finger protein